MKDTDLMILRHLRKDGREKIVQISKDLDIPISTVRDRIKHLEKECIDKYTTLIDFKKIGYYVRFNILIRLKDEDVKSVAEYLKDHKNINSMYRVNSPYHLCIDSVFKDMAGLEDFTQELKHRFQISDMKPFQIIEELRREEFSA